MFKKGLLFILCVTLFACVKSKQFADDVETPSSVKDVFDQMINATAGSTPDTMKVGEYVYYQTIIRANTGSFESEGIYDTYEVKDKQAIIIPVEVDGQPVQAPGFSFVIIHTRYKNAPNPNDPPVVDVQKEMDCEYVTQYKTWVKDCNGLPGGDNSLPPYQNFFLYNNFSTADQDIFYSLNTYKTVESLPPQLISDQRCYTFANCKANMDYIEYDEFDSTTNQRFHVINSYNNVMPYLASNPSYCIITQQQVVSNGQPVTATIEQCSVLADFKYGSDTP